MPLTYLLCPDKNKIEVAQCLTECRLEHRCLTLPTLKTITQDREWKGIPSTTQLINGTMQEYLKIIHPYTVDPQDRAFALLGTRHHQTLELSGGLAELPIGEEITSTVDLVEITDGLVELYDYKTWGSYRVAKALGLEKIGKDQYRVNPAQVDMDEVTLQLNHYRIQVEEHTQLKVNALYTQITVRDGGTYLAKGRGINKNIYLLPVAIWSDEVVRAYFDHKKEALLHALEHQEMPELCSSSESWDGRRCEGYCEVAPFCPRGITGRR